MELNYLTKKLFKKDSFRDLSAVELDELVGKYPYSSLLQFLYAKKLKDKNAFGYPDAAARSALYFNNPHWLNHLINDHDENGFAHVGAERSSLVEKIVYREAAVSSNDNFQGSVSSETLVEEFSETSSEPESESQNPVPMHEFQATDTLEPAQGHDEQPVSIVNGVRETSQEIHENAEVQEFNRPNAENQAEQVVVSSSSIETETPVEEKIGPEVLVEERTEKEPTIEENIKSEASAEESTETEPPVEEKIYSGLSEAEVKVSIADTEVREPIVETEFRKPVEIVSRVDEPIVPIEPLYSIDYFASQGIRLTAEEETKDKLGRSLKSFTEWLKSMKRIHPEKMAEKMDPGTEKHIQSEAEHSNEETEVNTEAMAEVLVKQGRRERAIELYEKLSLLNPAKSAYFAAKIKDLKEH